MLDKIETELVTAGAAEKWRLRQRAELVRGLLTACPPALSRSS
jgi:hypothetical protein